MPYIGKSPTGSGVRTRYYFTATGGETSLSGADDGGKTLTFSDGEYVDVYLNGIALVAGTDYGTATANTISGLAALSGGDIVEVVVYDIYNVAKINSEAVRTRHYYTATGGETSIGTAQIPGLSFPGGTEIEVSLNGISLVQGTDYNTTAANTIGGLSALSAGNVVAVVLYDKFQLADTVSKAQGGAFSGPVTASGGLNVGTIKEATGTTDAISIDSSGRVEIKQNSTATSNYATSGAWVISGVPDWADKIKFVGYRLSADTQGDTYFRVTVGGTAVIGTAYKHTQVVFNNAAAVATYDRSAGHGQIEIEGFAATANLFNWIVEIYKIDTNIYGFTANVANHTYGTYYVIQAGTIETSGAIDGVQLIASGGNFDSGKARLFWG